jgi:hypothetical protein
LLAAGYDTIQEAWDCLLPASFVEKIAKAREDAQALSDRGDGEVLIRFKTEDRPFKVSAHGAKGVKYVIGGDDFMILIRAPDHDWPLSVRYLSAGLWEHGIDALRARVDALLQAEGVQGTEPGNRRLSRVDVAFDFWSEAFTAEMVPGISGKVIAHARTKIDAAIGEAVKVREIGRPGVVETLTIGARTGLQIQVYDKGLEITEASGKTWMIDLWMERGFAAPVEGRPEHVWRLEIRFGKEFLKDRNVRSLEAFGDVQYALIAEALCKRRLTVPRNDSNRRRWPLHPLWAIAWEGTGRVGEFLPRGRLVTGRRDALMRQARAQIGGAIRSAAVLLEGDYRSKVARSIANEAIDEAEARQNHNERIQAGIARYVHVEDAR